MKNMWFLKQRTGFAAGCKLAHLSMYQSIIEEDEPVHREPSRVLQGQGPIAALTDQTPLRLPQGVLQGGQHKMTQSHSSLTVTEGWCFSLSQ